MTYDKLSRWKKRRLYLCLINKEGLFKFSKLCERYKIPPPGFIVIKAIRNKYNLDHNNQPIDKLMVLAMRSRNESQKPQKK